MADRPLKELEGRTPLEAANTPNLDAIAKRGVCGIMDIIAPGQPPGSDIANLTLLGYAPVERYRGRGALEAMGAGLVVEPGDVAFRGNFAHVSDEEVVVDRRAGRVEGSIFEEALADVRLVAHDDVEVVVKPTLAHRVAAVFRGEGLSWRISDIDPHENGAKVLRSEPLEETEAARKTASAINELYGILRMRLKNHPLNRERAKRCLPPANAVLFRGAGEVPSVEPLSNLYRIKGACVTMTPTVKGACLFTGFNVFEAPGATGGIDTDAVSKARTALKVLPRYDLVYVHVKGTDVASHDGKSGEKIRVIEKIDALVGHLIENVDPDDTCIAVTADHTTSIVVGNHTGDPVPVAVSGPGVRADAVESFTERACAVGGLGRIRGKDLMLILLDLQGRVNLIGS